MGRRGIGGIIGDLQTIANNCAHALPSPQRRVRVSSMMLNGGAAAFHAETLHPVVCAMRGRWRSWAEAHLGSVFERAAARCALYANTPRRHATQRAACP